MKDPGSDVPSDPPSSPDPKTEGTMPEYLAPGVYVEETSLRPRAIPWGCHHPLRLDRIGSREWKSGRLEGEKPEEAFFVRCDRTTMTQADIDNGRLVCVIGVAPSHPAESVIFRIGQKTADSNR